MQLSHFSKILKQYIIGPKLPEIKEKDYKFVRSILLAKVWSDADDTIKKLPEFLMHSYHFVYPKKDLVLSEWTVEAIGPSTIYLAETSTKNEKDMISNGWKKEGGEVDLSCCKLRHIWSKKLTKETQNSIELPKIDSKQTLRVIFIRGIKLRIEFTIFIGIWYKGDIMTII